MSPTVINSGKGILYARVSHLNETSVASQLKAGRAWAEREGKTIVAEYFDDGVSAFNVKADRPGWRQVMADLALGNATFLWCWEISRHVRDREVWARLIRTCQASDTMMVVGDRAHDPNDPDDGFMLDLSAALAVRESAMTRKRILRAVEDRAMAGKPHGKIPYAYRREYDPQSGALLRQVPNEETAPVVRDLARRVLLGESMYSIAIDLNERGVPSPETVRQRRMHGPDVPLIAWYPSEIRELILSPTNAGHRLHQGVVVADAAWPAVISPADHAALAAKLADPGRPVRRDAAARHLLTRIAECGVCGSLLRHVKNRGYSSYACPGKDGRGASCVVRRLPYLDAFVEETVLAFCENPAVYAMLTAPEEDTDAARAAVELADLRARLDSFFTSASRKNGITAEALEAIEARMRPQIVEAEMRAVPRSLPPVVTGVVGPQARQVWEDMTVPVRRQVVRFLMRVIVHKAGRGHGMRGFDPERIQISWRVGPDSSPGR